MGFDWCGQASESDAPNFFQFAQQVRQFLAWQFLRRGQHELKICSHISEGELSFLLLPDIRDYGFSAISACRSGHYWDICQTTRHGFNALGVSNVCQDRDSIPAPDNSMHFPE
jgi:hypothetical protein